MDPEYAGFGVGQALRVQEKWTEQPKKGTAGAHIRRNQKFKINR